MSQPLTLVGIGCGGRTRTYCELAAHLPQRYRVVGAADPNPVRVQQTKELSKNPDFRSFASDSELFAAGKIADVCIIGTQDAYHVEPALKALALGYDLLLHQRTGVGRLRLHALRHDRTGHRGAHIAGRHRRRTRVRRTLGRPGLGTAAGWGPGLTRHWQGRSSSRRAGCCGGLRLCSLAWRPGWRCGGGVQRARRYAGWRCLGAGLLADRPCLVGARACRSGAGRSGPTRSGRRAGWRTGSGRSARRVASGFALARRGQAVQREGPIRVRLGAQVQTLSDGPFHTGWQLQQAPAQKQGKLIPLGLHRALNHLPVGQVQQPRGTGLHQRQRHLPLWKNHGGRAHLLRAVFGNGDHGRTR